mmetsp:Transcript_50588/g.101000  ORF Transcript_50588/g.101000 Transcript_50588/m.101000 type:complete len:266 (+) Transcript_50588:331-1128(+)
MAGQFARTVSCATYLTKPSCELPRIWSISWIVSMGALQCGAVAVSSRLAERSRRRTRDWRGHGRAAGDPGRASSTGTGVCRAHRRSDHRARHRQDTLTFRTPSDCLLPHLAIPTRLLSSCNESAWRSEHSGYDSTAEIRAHSLSVMSVLKLICCLQGLSAGRAAHPWTAPHHSRPLEAGRSACLLVAAADFLTTAVAPASPLLTAHPCFHSCRWFLVALSVLKWWSQVESARCQRQQSLVSLTWLALAPSATASRSPSAATSREP